ncbi:MAG TPA: small multi-drug export protein [Sunxiuqinia sp.]|nr:small multi-drug export protein [Sunxiuqinia sp.]
MNEFYAYILVFLTSFIGIWKSIPVGIAFGLNPLLTGVLTALGGVCSVLIIYFAGSNVRTWVECRMGQKKMGRKTSQFNSWLNRYGLLGIGLLAPGPLGQIVPIIIGLAILSNRRKYLIYHCVGTILWSIVLSFLFLYLADWTMTDLITS